MIATIAILAGLLLPALSNVKARVHSMKCVSNLRQISAQYDNRKDHAQVFEPQSDNLLGPNRNILEGGIEICPSAPLPPVVPVMQNGFKMGSISSPWWQEIYQDIGDRVVLYQTAASSYGFNFWLGSHDPERGFYSDVDFLFPSTTPSFADAAGPFCLLWSDQLPPRNLKEPDGHAAFFIPRHGKRPREIPTDHPPEQKLPGAINMAFCDGHVEQVQLERWWSFYWHKGYVAPEKRPGL